ncbi:septum formation protein Maf [Rhodobacteraceae bacterium CCMM004]|nr:septum formation protein Maf [Rhodobacteraceae bacterium CCMM004]
MPGVILVSVPILLASGSATRQAMLRDAAIPCDVVVPRVDEAAIRDALLADRHPPRDIADALAEAKARKVAMSHPDRLVLGCDQVLEHRGALLSKPQSPEEARAQLASLSGDRHTLWSAAVVYEDGRPVWRHVGEVRLHMRTLSQDYISDYVARNYDTVQHCVGGYRLEAEGARFFTRIDGDFFAVLGLPLLPLLSWLIDRGNLAA